MLLLMALKHAVVVSFQRRLHTGRVSKKYNGLHAAVLDIFCQDKAKTVSPFHRSLVHENYGCAQALITTPDSLKRQVKEEPGSVRHKKSKQSYEQADSEVQLEEELSSL